MKMKNPPIETISRFVLRARLVQEHSLAKDKLILKRHTEWEMSFIVTENRKTGERSMEMKPASLLPTEQVESGAARVRPLFLKSDGVHYGAVLDSVLAVVAVPTTELQEAVEALRKKFRAADPDYPTGRPKGPRDESGMSNKQLAGAWLYGHLLHEDAVRRTYSAGFSAEEMLHNAAKTVCSEMLATVETLHLIERLVVEGTLDLPETLFTDSVTVTAPEWAPKNVRAYVAEVGTPMPGSLIEPLGDEWKDIHDVFGPGARGNNEITGDDS